MKLATIAALVGSTALMAVPLAAQTQQPQQAGQNDCTQLVQFLEQHQRAAPGREGQPPQGAQQQQQAQLPVTLQQARKYQQGTSKNLLAISLRI
jgi:hypothetical protein